MTVDKTKEDLAEKLRRHTPVNLSYGAIALMMASTAICMRRDTAWKMAYKRAALEYEKYMRRNRSNNWLRMHGYPTRRKCHK